MQKTGPAKNGRKLGESIKLWLGIAAFAVAIFLAGMNVSMWFHAGTHGIHETPDEKTERIKDVTAPYIRHMAIPGHPVIIERVGRLEEESKRRFDEIIKTQNDILKELRALR